MAGGEIVADPLCVAGGIGFYRWLWFGEDVIDGIIDQHEVNFTPPDIEIAAVVEPGGGFQLRVNQLG